MVWGVLDFSIHQITEGTIGNIAITDEKTVKSARIQKYAISRKTRGRPPDNNKSSLPNRSSGHCM
jgi:hypothetical protein